MEANSSVESKIQALEAGLEDLKHKYEQYFLGQLRIEPKAEHDDWKRKLLQSNPAEMSSTSQKFRFVNLKARYNQLQVHWEKICHQIEEGTYKRDKFLLKVHSSKEESTNAKPPDSSRALEISTKEKKAIDTLYQKLKEASGNQKVPNAESFLKKMEQQVLHFKEKNPGKPIAFKLAKDEKGKIQVKIAAKDKS